MCIASETQSVRDTQLTLIKELDKSPLNIADECQAKKVGLSPSGGGNGKTYYQKAEG